MLTYRNTSVFFLVLILIAAGADRYIDISVWVYVVIGLCWTAILALGSINITWNFYFKSYYRANTEKHEIALTFDDGPHTCLTPAVLDILKVHEVKAAFFLIGRLAAESPAIVSRIDAEGHVLGNHSFSHHYFFDLFPARKMQDELKQTAEAIEEVTGRKIRWFRPPYGVTNPMLASAVRRSGYISIGWSLKSRDTVLTDSREVTDRILERVRPGDVLLFHDSRSVTPVVLKELIPALKKKGFTIVRPDRLLNLTAYENN
jgi:peptidoglycan/xylan/chitin deacetylase (PgdA/CDA1 family)